MNNLPNCKGPDINLRDPRFKMRNGATDAKMAAVLVLVRLCQPSSELHIAEDGYRRTALTDLLQLGDEEIDKDRLYRGLDHLLCAQSCT